jgi:hypothetical protein
MNVLSQVLDFPGFVLPAFAAGALLLAFLLRGRGAARPLRYGDAAAALIAILAIVCVAHATYGFFIQRHEVGAPATAAPAFIEVDMRISKGSIVELFQNDWTHGSESAPVAAGQRQIYRFPVERPQIGLLRLDPSDAAKAKIEIYALRVTQGSTIWQAFSPAQLKGWTLVNLSQPKEDAGALVFESTNDDPILWTTPLDVRIAEAKAPSPQSWANVYSRPLASGTAALILAILLVVIRIGKGPARLKQPLRAPAESMFLRAWVLGLLTFAAAATTVYLQGHRANSDIRVDVDMMASGGKVVEMWMNNLEDMPQKIRVVPGQRRIYTFRQVPQHLMLLRLDPTDAANMRIVVYGIAVKNDRQIFAQFDPAVVKTWGQTNLSMPQDAEGGVEWTSANHDPTLLATLDLRLPGGPLGVLSRLVETADAPFLLAITAMLGALLVRMTTRSGRRQAVLVALVIGVALPVMLAVLDWDILPPPGVRLAVGYSGYNGYPKANEYLGAAAVLLIAIGLGFAIARWAARDGVEPEETVDPPSRRWVAWTAYAAVFVSLLFYFFPDLDQLLNRLAGIAFQRDNWDILNWTTWDFLLAKGLRPFRDFWFPYSGSYVLNLQPPVGETYWTLHCTLTIAVLYVGLFQLTGRRVLQALVLWAMMAPLAMMDIFLGWQRYLLAVDVALLYVSARQARRWEWSTHGLFAVWTGYAFFYEQTQAIYPAVGIAADTLLCLAGRWRTGDWRGLVKQRAVTVVVPMLAGIGGALAIFAANGMLPGLLDFDSTLGAQADYGALPSPIAEWLRPALQPESVFLLLFLLSAYAVYRWLRSKDREHDTLGVALIVLCCTSYVAMSKQVMRPHVMQQVRVFPYAAAMVFGLIVWRERRPAGRAIVVLFIGCIAGVLLQRQFPELWMTKEKTAPRRIANTLNVLLHRRQQLDEEVAATYSRPHFAAFAPEGEVVDHLVRDLGRKPTDAVYVLGDAPIFYVLLEQAAPYINNAYNDSPISEQEKIVDWFRRVKPRFVVWSTDVLAYDEVPHAVRLPLIYAYVVDHYKFEKAIGAYHVLVERAPGDSADPEYWKSVLGDRVDLGYVPRLAKASDYAACGADMSSCEPMMVVRFAGPVGRRKTSMTIAADTGIWRVDLQVTPEHREYLVNLDRLWFWDRTKKVPVRMWAADGRGQVTMEYRRPRGRVLY